MLLCGTLRIERINLSTYIPTNKAMQEVTIKQRSYFVHLVTVEEGQRELSWSFNTRRKNLSFALYYKPFTSSTVPSNSDMAEITLGPEASVEPIAKPAAVSAPSLLPARSRAATRTTSSKPPLMPVQDGERPRSPNDVRRSPRPSVHNAKQEYLHPPSKFTYALG
jgi:hypothetical protein